MATKPRHLQFEVSSSRRSVTRPRSCGVTKFTWEMVRNDTGQIASVGVEFFVLADDAPIRADYQFIER